MMPAIIYPTPQPAGPKPPFKMCAWCGAIIAIPYAGGGHGICPHCFDKIKKQALDEGYIAGEDRSILQDKLPASPVPVPHPRR